MQHLNFMLLNFSLYKSTLGCVILK
uniref:Uncharacterized protein n=1 Tax=Arundo donax TaxID=35708 RepID=A0A0A9C1J6_ARUDO